MTPEQVESVYFAAYASHWGQPDVSPADVRRKAWQCVIDAVEAPLRAQLNGLVHGLAEQCSRDAHGLGRQID